MNVVPAGSAAVERREAPHPYVTGVRAPSHGARGVSQAPQGCLASTPAPPGAPSPLLARERKKGKGRRPAPERCEWLGSVSVGCSSRPDLIRARRAASPSNPGSSPEEDGGLFDR